MSTPVLDYPTPSHGSFKPLRGRANATVVLLTITVVFSILLIAFKIIMILHPALAVTTDHPTANQLTFLFVLAGVGCGSLAIMVATAVLFVMWQYRANANLHALRIPRLKFTPGWSVGWWFIPIMSLVKPYQAIRELWLASDSTLVPDGRWEDAPGAAVVGWWWAAYLVSSILAWTPSFLTAEEGPLKSIGDAMDLTSMVLNLVAAILIIGLVRRITARIEALPALPQFAELPPPIEVSTLFA